MNHIPKLRVGIVGCGYLGGRLARAIALVDSLTVSACEDIIPERAVELAAFAGGASSHAFTSFGTITTHAGRPEQRII